MSHCPAAAACRNINALWHDISDITVNYWVNKLIIYLVTIIVFVLIASSTVATTASNLAAYDLVA